MKWLYFTSKTVCKFTLKGFTFHYIALKVDHNHLVLDFLMSLKATRIIFAIWGFCGDTGKIHYPIKWLQPKKEPAFAWFRLRVCAACKTKSPGKSKALFFRGVFALPSPASSSDLIKQKKRMESLPLLLHSAGIIRAQNKLGGLIQLS